MLKLTWNVGDVVRKLRESKRPEWSQIVLARKAGVDKSTIVRLEKGGNSGPETVRKVAIALQVSMAQLYASVPPQEWPADLEELDAWKVFQGITDPTDRRQALERLERVSTVKRSSASDVADAR